eukprot:2576874-Amphidinium_carterae.1
MTKGNIRKLSCGILRQALIQSIVCAFAPLTNISGHFAPSLRLLDALAPVLTFAGPSLSHFDPFPRSP